MRYLQLVAVALTEYLSTVYEPDYDFLLGDLLERNSGQSTHSATLGIVLRALFSQGSWRQRSSAIRSVPLQ